MSQLGHLWQKALNKTGIPMNIRIPHPKICCPFFTLQEGATACKREVIGTNKNGLEGFAIPPQVSQPLPTFDLPCFDIGSGSPFGS